MKSAPTPVSRPAPRPVSSPAPHYVSPDQHDTRPVSRGWYVLLLLPFVAMLWVGSYNKIEPTLWGFPFFYWYQLLWVLLCAVIVGIVFVATRRSAD